MSSESSTATPVQTKDSLKETFGDYLKTYRPLWPCILGLTVGRAGLIVASYGSYNQTDEGIFTDGSMLVALAILGLLLIALVVKNSYLNKQRVNRLMRACVAAEVITLFMLAIMNFVGYYNDGLRLALSIFITLTASGAMFYWLRRARGSNTSTAAVFVFSALFFSEIEIYICSLLPDGTSNLIAGILALLQFPCMIWARTQTQPFKIKSPTQDNDYFGFAKTMLSNKMFLTATAVGIGFLSLVIGLLRGYPNGSAIVFTPPTRLAYGVLTMTICVVITARMLRGKHNTMTIGIWVLMQVLAFGALFLYAAIPGNLEFGAVFTTTLNAVMVGFTWYIVIAFMSYGWRCPYYYAITGWIVWLGARAVARIALMKLYPVSTNDSLMIVLISGLLIFSAQVVFVQFIGISKRGQEEAEDVATEKRTTLQKLMGLDGNENLAGIRQASMQHNAEEMGKQFLLSEREIEVLALYALGFTQQRVADELYITAGTAHAHIKRIYSKTGLHSRQEIIDYLQKYTS
ncbi:MAG: LuxR C-terminal-related transcriptional regulator [Raoultibacter sp.]